MFFFFFLGGGLEVKTYVHQACVFFFGWGKWNQSMGFEMLR